MEYILLGDIIGYWNDSISGRTGMAILCVVREYQLGSARRMRNRLERSLWSYCFHVHPEPGRSPSTQTTLDIVDVALPQ